MAEVTFVSTKRLSLQGSLDIGGDFFALPHSNFGAGSYAKLPSGDYKRHGDVSYSEFFGKPAVTGRWDTPWGFSVIGKASAVGSGTVGDGDAMSISQTAGGPSAVTWEEGYLGVVVPFKLLHTKQTLTVQGGRQAFTIDDGFLVGKGGYSTTGTGAWWYAPRYAFAGPGTIKIEGENTRADIFMLENSTNNQRAQGNDRPRTKFVGFDFSWFINTKGGNGGKNYFDRKAYVTLTYFHVLDADVSSTYDYAVRADRRGMNVTSLSWGGNVLPVKALNMENDFTFYGNFVSEQNSHAGNGYTGVQAFGMYFEPGYTFSKLPWKPHVFYRYTRYGGAKNTTDKVKRNYDPFFLYDGKRYVYGGYWPGEIVGMYLAPLSDLEIHQFDVTATPPIHLFKRKDEVKLGVHYYDLSLIHVEGMWLPKGTGRHISREVDLTVEYNMDDTTSFALGGGVAFAGPAGRSLAAASIPTGYQLHNLGEHAGVFEGYFYKHF